MTNKDVSKESTSPKLPLEIEIVIQTNENKLDDLNTTSAVSNITECNTSVATSSHSSSSIGNKRPRNCHNVNVYDKYKRKYHTRPTFNQYGSVCIDNTHESRIGKAEKPHPVQETSSSSTPREKYSGTTSPVTVRETIVTKPSPDQIVDLQKASAAQLLTALKEKGYKTIEDLSQLADMDIDASNSKVVSNCNNDNCPDNVINCIGLKQITFKARDAVHANILSGIQITHPEGNRSEFVTIMTTSHGPQPINVYSDDRRTDSQLAVQAKKNYKYKLRRKLKAAEKKKNVVTNHSSIDKISSKTSHKYIGSHCNLDLPSVDLGIRNETSEISLVYEKPSSKTTLDIPFNNINVVDETDSSNKLTVMLIGLCNRDIISSLDKNEINGIVNLSDKKGKYYNQSVVRDT